MWLNRSPSLRGFNSVGLTLEVVAVGVTAGYDAVDMEKVCDVVERGADDEVLL